MHLRLINKAKTLVPQAYLPVSRCPTWTRSIRWCKAWELDNQQHQVSQTPWTTWSSKWWGTWANQEHKEELQVSSRQTPWQPWCSKCSRDSDSSSLESLLLPKQDPPDQAPLKKLQLPEHTKHKWLQEPIKLKYKTSLAQHAPQDLHQQVAKEVALSNFPMRMSIKLVSFATAWWVQTHSSQALTCHPFPMSATQFIWWDLIWPIWLRLCRDWCPSCNDVVTLCKERVRSLINPKEERPARWPSCWARPLKKFLKLLAQYLICTRSLRWDPTLVSAVWRSTSSTQCLKQWSENAVLFLELALLRLPVRKKRKLNLLDPSLKNLRQRLRLLRLLQQPVMQESSLVWEVNSSSSRCSLLWWATSSRFLNLRNVYRRSSGLSCQIGNQLMTETC